MRTRSWYWWSNWTPPYQRQGAVTATTNPRIRHRRRRSRLTPPPAGYGDRCDRARSGARTPRKPTGRGGHCGTHRSRKRDPHCDALVLFRSCYLRQRCQLFIGVSWLVCADLLFSSSHSTQSWSWVGSIHGLGWVGWRLDCVIFLTSWNILLSVNEYCSWIITFIDSWLVECRVNKLNIG